MAFTPYCQLFIASYIPLWLLRQAAAMPTIEVRTFVAEPDDISQASGVEVPLVERGALGVSWWNFNALATLMLVNIQPSNEH